MLTVQELVDDNADKIPFNWISGQGAADRAIPDDGMAAADLVGHLNLIHPSRIQVFGQDVQVLLRGGFGHQQAQQHRDRLAVGGVERDGLRQADEGGKRLLQAFHAAVRHGHALTEGG